MIVLLSLIACVSAEYYVFGINGYKQLVTVGKCTYFNYDSSVSAPYHGIITKNANGKAMLQKYSNNNCQTTVGELKEFTITGEFTNTIPQHNFYRERGIDDDCKDHEKSVKTLITFDVCVPSTNAYDQNQPMSVIWSKNPSNDKQIRELSYQTNNCVANGFVFPLIYDCDKCPLVTEKFYYTCKQFTGNDNNTNGSGSVFISLVIVLMTLISILF